MISAILITIFITYYATRLFFFLPAYKNQMSFIMSNIDNFPDCFAAWTWLGIEKKNMNMRYGALEAWQEGLKLRPNDFRLNWNVAAVCGELGFADEAIRFYETAKVSAIPDTVEDKLSKAADGEIAKIRSAMTKAQEQYRNHVIDQARAFKKGINNGH